MPQPHHLLAAQSWPLLFKISHSAYVPRSTAVLLQHWVFPLIRLKLCHSPEPVTFKRRQLASVTVSANGPAASSPLSPPADSSDDTPDSEASAPSIPSGNTGSKTTTGESSISNGSSVTMPFHLTVFFLFLASNSCMLFLRHYNLQLVLLF
ncbi:hypothetical protein LWI28_016319 [Acer negundo]|uniref:Uncharacterized protein n=1 Tax=Acer negundo TaxID=4023 RepID=A0AAD5IJZ8_ACENE|nr:hypothetical protein LWI28_016319 [Acer negundo]